MWLHLMWNNCNALFIYRISRDFYIWILSLSALKILFCWSLNSMLLVVFLPLSYFLHTHRFLISNCSSQLIHYMNIVQDKQCSMMFWLDRFRLNQVQSKAQNTLNQIWSCKIKNKNYFNILIFNWEAPFTILPNKNLISYCNKENRGL